MEMTTEYKTHMPIPVLEMRKKMPLTRQTLENFYCSKGGIEGQSVTFYTPKLPRN